MKNICKYLGYCTAGFGFLISIGMAKGLGVSLKETLWSAELVRNWPLTIFYFILGLFITAVCTSILLGISEILECLELVKRDQTEDVALANLAKIEADTFWMCPHCGKHNPPYTGTCSCGQSKP